MTRSTKERVTIVDVAKAAGVALSSVSFALNDRPGVSETTRAHVKKIAADLGYVPSIRGRILSAKRAFSVGLVVERDVAVLEADPFFGAFIGGIEQTIVDRGYMLALTFTADREATLQRHLELAQSRRVDGLFLNELQRDDPRVEELAALGFPAVGVNAPSVFPYPAVRQDGTDAIRQLIAEYAALGHRGVAHVSGPDAFSHSGARQEAWSNAVTENGLTHGPVVGGEFTFEGGQRAADALLSLETPPTAVFCANDQSAAGFIHRALSLGYRVPADISVVGFDGNAIGKHIHPSLTTVQTDARGLGREAARLLLAAVDGEDPQDAELAPAYVVNRDSVARARTSNPKLHG